MPDTPPRIDEAELLRRLMDPEVPDAEIAPYLMEDTRQTRGFEPVIVPNMALVEPSVLEGAVLMSSVNQLSRWRRDRRYRSKIKTWTGPRLVSEGDSWFQYPILLADVIDQLDDDFAIRSLGAAGDLIKDMVAQDELVATVAAENPDAVLLSGGGNDLLGEGRLVKALKPFDPSFGIEDYVTEDFEATLRDVIGLYRGLIVRLVRAFPDLPVVVHGYDHAIPARGRWLGRPMEALGITDPALQAQLTAHLVDRFYGALRVLIAEPGLAGSVRLVDCRAIVQGEWHDELHPTSAGYARVADEFRKALSDIMPSPFEGMAELPAGPPPTTFGIKAAAEAAARLAGTLSPEALEAELGRRALLGSVEPERAVPLDGDISVMALEGAGDVFRKVGRRILRRLNRELHGLICGDGDDDREDREKLRGALGLDDAAIAGTLVQILVSSFGLMPAVATVVAALLIKRVLRPSLEEMCEVWGESPLLADDG